MDGVNAKEIASIYVDVLPADENTVSVGSVSLSTDYLEMKTNTTLFLGKLSLKESVCLKCLNKFGILISSLYLCMRNYYHNYFLKIFFQS